MSLLTGVSLFVFLFLGALVSLILLLPTIILTLIHSLRVIRTKWKYIDTVSNQYFEFATSIIRIICGTEIYLYSADDILSNQNIGLIISNHVSRVDYMFLGFC